MRADRIKQISSLKGKKILVFAPKFFDYENSIRNELERMGATVHLYDERPNPTSVEKILIRKARPLIKGKIDRYYAEVNEKEREFSPDYILFINSEAVDKESLDLLKATHQNAIFLLYMWDSTKNKKIKQYFGEFDRLYSFDKGDCEKYGMIFRPLFFIPTFEQQKYVDGKSTVNDEAEKEYDISFIGTVHSDRVKIVSKLKDYCDENDISYYWYLYVPGKLMYFLRWCTDSAFRKIDKKYVHKEPMPKDEFAKVSESTRCVLDINHPKQTGLTMRTIEMLGSCRKIITTNGEIKDYDFYIPSNQIVIFRDGIKLEKEAIRKDYIDIDEKLYEKYAIRGWINDIFQLW
jgi:hypothetical protein